MESKKISIEYQSGDSYSELSKEFVNLIEITKEFSKNAYAPYSNFRVSACLQLNKGEIIKGANVENASYPVGICAERTLISHTVSNYPKAIIEMIAIYVDKDLDVPVPPCGMCRQSLLETEDNQKSDIQIILVNKAGAYLIFENCRDLLPLSFQSKYL